MFFYVFLKPKTDSHICELSVSISFYWFLSISIVLYNYPNIVPVATEAIATFAVVSVKIIPEIQFQL